MVMLMKFLSLSLIIHTFFILTTQSYDYFTNCTFSPNTTQNSPFETNLQNLFNNLPSHASVTGFYKSSSGQNPNQVYALYLCRADVSAQQCSECVYEAQLHILQQCPSQIKAVIWYDECMLRFSNESVFRRMVSFPSNVVWNPENVTKNETKLFVDGLNKTVNDLVDRVAKSVIKFGTQESNVTKTQKLYKLGQCTPDLTASDCEKCLRIAIPQLPFLHLGGKVLQPSCNIRFEVSPFYDNSVNVSFLQPVNSTTSLREKKKRSTHITIAVTVPLVLAVLLLCGACCFYKQKGRKPSPELDEIITVESLQYDFRNIKTATANFSEDNKLGQGGFGAVYKGRLQNGQEIAVKRLSKSSGQGSKEFKTEVLLVARLQHNNLGMLKDGQEVAIKRLSKNSSQGIEEFKTEVELVAKLQHKNLVKLLGFCLASKEKILVVVYEFLQNSSLDHFLFDLTKKLSLDWEVRFKLIVGISRGLLYLHKDSRLKIIHRDLKPSNILLDEHMNPKISDFGLARLFGADQTQDDTKKIVGTYGYMAPEYAMTGHFSVKSDVYSFGIIVLEIISGQKNKFFGRPQQEEALLHRAWRLWNEGKGLDLVDTTLEKKYPKEEVLKCIQIGLLSIQENPIDRPTMATIVAALNGQSISLPLPKAPNFFGNVATTSNNCSPYYNSLIGENGIVYHPQLDQQGFINVYTGSDKITTLYPR